LSPEWAKAGTAAAVNIVFVDLQSFFADHYVSKTSASLQGVRVAPSLGGLTVAGLNANVLYSAPAKKSNDNNSHNQRAFET